MPRSLTFLCLFLIALMPFKTTAEPATGLEITAPHTLSLVYTIEPEAIDQIALASLIDEVLEDTPIQLAPRDDAQLFLRVETHADRYLLYLDFSRKVFYCANGKTFSKAGFVWGRYAKDISDTAQLHEDVTYLFEEFISQYLDANQLK